MQLEYRREEIASWMLGVTRRVDRPPRDYVYLYFGSIRWDWRR